MFGRLASKERLATKFCFIFTHFQSVTQHYKQNSVKSTSTVNPANPNITEDSLVKMQAPNYQSVKVRVSLHFSFSYFKHIVQYSMQGIAWKASLLAM